MATRNESLAAFFILLSGGLSDSTHWRTGRWASDNLVARHRETRHRARCRQAREFNRSHNTEIVPVVITMLVVITQRQGGSLRSAGEAISSMWRNAGAILSISAAVTPKPSK